MTDTKSDLDRATLDAAIAVVKDWRERHLSYSKQDRPTSILHTACVESLDGVIDTLRALKDKPHD